MLQLHLEEWGHSTLHRRVPTGNLFRGLLHGGPFQPVLDLTDEPLLAAGDSVLLNQREGTRHRPRSTWCEAPRAPRLIPSPVRCPEDSDVSTTELKKEPVPNSIPYKTENIWKEVCMIFQTVLKSYHPKQNQTSYEDEFPSLSSWGGEKKEKSNSHS